MDDRPEWLEAMRADVAMLIAGGLRGTHGEISTTAASIVSQVIEPLVGCVAALRGTLEKIASHANAAGADDELSYDDATDLIEDFANEALAALECKSLRINGA